MLILEFQSTLPHGERPIPELNPFMPNNIISIHAPARGATLAWIKACICGRFQSTLPHGERRFQSGCILPSTLISIHAPARGATHWGVNECGYDEISIHAPARGATFKKMFDQIQEGFQSTLPHGERLPNAKIIFFTGVFQSTLPHGERLFLSVF